MSRSFLRRLAPAALLLFTLTACADGGDDPATSSTTEAATETASDAETASELQTEDGAGTDAEVAGDAATFPVTVSDNAGEVTIDDEPQSIVSLSPTATEMLFALGAGDQVVAVDDFSNFPEEAPTTDLSGFNPNAEAVLEFEPDLVVIANDSNDLVASLTEAGVPVLQFSGPSDLAGAFSQFEAIGAATGTDAEATVEAIRKELDDISASTDVEAGLTYYHELSSDLFTATSATFIGEVYGLFGMENIADEADADAGGFPQLSAEFVVEQDPDYVFLACTVFCGETVDSFCGREGFGDLTACAEGNVVELNDDVASRWGPRVVDFAESVADALPSS